MEDMKPEVMAMDVSLHHIAKRPRRQGSNELTTLSCIPQELVLSVLQYIDGRSVVLLSSTCRYLKAVLELLWVTFFRGYIGVSPNVHAASWKDHFKGMFCAKERRCFVCLEKNSPSIRPWKYVNLCHDHRKHCTKSVLISKSYAKEQFALNDIDMAPLQFIVRGRMKLYLEMEAMYCAVSKHGGLGGLQRIQQKKIQKWQKRKCIVNFKHQEIFGILNNDGVSKNVSPRKCSKYSDYLNRPRTKLSAKMVAQCVRSHSKSPRPATPNWLDIRARAVRRYLCQIGRPYAFHANEPWIGGYCLSKDPAFTPAIAFSKFNSSKQRQEDIKSLCINGLSNCYDKVADVFHDAINTFTEHGEVVLGFGKSVNKAEDVARILVSCYGRLREVANQMFPEANAEDVQVMRGVLEIAPFKTFVLDGVVPFLGATFAGAQKLVHHYVDAAKKCTSLEAKLFQRMKQAGSSTCPARGFLSDALNSAKACDQNLASLVETTYHEWLRRDALKAVCDDADVLDPGTIDHFVRHGYATLNGIRYSHALSLVRAVDMEKRHRACRREAIFETLKSRGALCHDVGLYHHCVFRWVNEHIVHGHIPFSYAIETTVTYLYNQELIWKAMKYFGVARDHLPIRRESHSCSILEEYILSGSCCIDGEVTSDAKCVVLYLLYVEKWSCPLYLDAVLKLSTVSVCAEFGLSSNVCSSLREMRDELSMRMDPESFIDTIKTARRVVSTYVSKSNQQLERAKRLHEALVSRKWPEISFANIDLRHIFVANGLPCFCGIEVSTMDQLADVLVTMHVSSIRRSIALDFCLRDLGIPKWTFRLNRPMRFLSSQYVLYGVAPVAKDFVLASVKSIGQRILLSPEYGRQMSLWRLAQQHQVDLITALAEVDDFVNQLVLDWIERGAVQVFQKLVPGGTINNVDDALDFLMDHYHPRSCWSCHGRIGASASGLKCSFCDSTICQSCAGECSKCGATLCCNCLAMDYSTNATATICMGDCLL